MLNLKTNELKTRKKVLIDDHEYIVRRMGNIEQLDYAQSLRRLTKLEAIETSDGLSEAEEAEVDDISKRLTNMFISLFDDGGDQTKSRALISSLSDSEIGEMMSQIFKDEDEAKVS